MPIRFRRSIGGKAFRINLGKTGITSVSTGRRGLHLATGKRGSRISAGIPGTGLSYSKKLSSGVDTNKDFKTVKSNTGKSQGCCLFAFFNLIVSFFVLLFNLIVKGVSAFWNLAIGTPRRRKVSLIAIGAICTQTAHSIFSWE